MEKYSKLFVFDLESYSIFMISVHSNVNVVCLSNEMLLPRRNRDACDEKRNIPTVDRTHAHAESVRERRKSKAILLMRDSVA